MGSNSRLGSAPRRIRSGRPTSSPSVCTSEATVTGSPGQTLTVPVRLFWLNAHRPDPKLSDPFSRNDAECELGRRIKSLRSSGGVFPQESRSHLIFETGPYAHHVPASSATECLHQAKTVAKRVEVLFRLEVLSGFGV